MSRNPHQQLLKGRAAFEAWARDAQEEWSLARAGSGYIDEYLDMAWNAWKDGIVHAARVCRSLEGEIVSPRGIVIGVDYASSLECEQALLGELES